MEKYFKMIMDKIENLETNQKQEYKNLNERFEKIERKIESLESDTIINSGRWKIIFVQWII